MHVDSYPFGTSLPGKGEGLCIVNIGADNNGYNMHFGAWVGDAPGGKIKVSNMNEPTGSYGLELLETDVIGHVDDFRVGGYEDKARFKIGKLTTSPSMGKTELK